MAGRTMSRGPGTAHLPVTHLPVIIRAPRQSPADDWQENREGKKISFGVEFDEDRLGAFRGWKIGGRKAGTVYSFLVFKLFV